MCKKMMFRQGVNEGACVRMNGWEKSDEWKERKKRGTEEGEEEEQTLTKITMEHLVCLHVHFG